MNSSFVDTLNKSLARDIRLALKISLANPRLAIFLIKTILKQKHAVRKRKYWIREGTHVPPFMIISVTRKCNLTCAGCYSRILHNNLNNELSAGQFQRIISEANQLGISVIFLAGGEPFMRQDIIDIATDFPEIIFPVFTNGLLIDLEVLFKLRKYRNIVPIISIEGHITETDQRRGEGVFKHFLKLAAQMKMLEIFWGVSITVTRTNADKVLSDAFIKQIIDTGCRLFVFVEYVPIKRETENLVLTAEQRWKLNYSKDRFRRKFNVLFTAFPGDEEKYGGCLAAGRGFIHVNPTGNIEPCPFAPYSDTNLNQINLKEALQSEFLKTIRSNHDKLTETTGGCALWENKKWVRSLLN